MHSMDSVGLMTLLKEQVEEHVAATVRGAFFINTSCVPIAAIPRLEGTAHGHSYIATS